MPERNPFCYQSIKLFFQFIINFKSLLSVLFCWGKFLDYLEKSVTEQFKLMVELTLLPSSLGSIST